MSLARNPQMPYQVAGEQSSPFEKMHVRRSVHVPCADVCDGSARRASYQAPAGTRRRAEYSVSMLSAIYICLAAILVMSVFYGIALTKRADMNAKRVKIVGEMQSAHKQITVLQEEVAQVRKSSRICYEAVQRLGMISCQGAEKIEVFAPDTRPVQSADSLAEGNFIARN